jgi:hypothetical protein
MVHHLMQVVSGSQTEINVNNEIVPCSVNSQGVQQGDPLSLIFSDFMVDSLAAVIF